jgi:methionyl aminopeptidase
MDVAEDLVGHGIGYHLHEDPAVYNIGRKGKGLKLEKGMVLAIEPMICLGSGAIIENNDESFSTFDKSLSAHFEHTVIITDDLPIITTDNHIWK